MQITFFMLDTFKLATLAHYLGLQPQFEASEVIASLNKRLLYVNKIKMYLTD